MEAAAVCDLVSAFFSGIGIEAEFESGSVKVANFIRMLRRL
jgi:hypothetical protein